MCTVTLEHRKKINWCFLFAYFLFGESRINDKHHTVNSERSLSNVC